MFTCRQVSSKWQRLREEGREQNDASSMLSLPLSNFCCTFQGKALHDKFRNEVPLLTDNGDCALNKKCLKW